ncbi:Brix-domain-containing protein [Vararia minispora EC-137]|uniref:Brix-domain-containing protein n=1 Tax=Vararia minispora EC-137 TaxID=1314806 RepID=A0ACB8Q978_9AGAM|nr:Brix-domain-containing protein [Vararia minispora EC-137]
MPTSRFAPPEIKNKFKREEVARKKKRAKGQAKLQRRLEIAKREADDPAVKKNRLAKNIPRTLDNTREYDPSFLTADPSLPQPEASGCEQSPSSKDALSAQPTVESAADLASDPFADYFVTNDPNTPPKVLITTSRKATRVTYEFCDELVGVFPGAEFYKRPKGREFETGRIAGWAAKRGYSNLIVVNEDTKKPNAITVVHLPNGPTAYFKLTSIELTQHIFGHARATPHYPELVLNNFVTRLGHTVGRMFQTFFPPLPEFQGRQVVTLHNQRDFLFFRRHRYAFRSDEKVALQEIGPRFTLKLRSLRTGIPAVHCFGESPQTLEFDDFHDKEAQARPEDSSLGKVGTDAKEDLQGQFSVPKAPPKTQEYEWIWKPELQLSKRTFFL